MDPDLYQKLRSADEQSDLQYWEYPLYYTHAQYTQLIQKVRDVALELGTAVGDPIRLEDEDSIQDASFAAQLSIQRKKYGLLVRFSNFTPLAVVVTFGEGDLSWGAPEVQDPDFQICTRVLEQHGFQLVDAHALMQTPYTGKLPVSGDSEFTWWTRFFDYL